MPNLKKCDFDSNLLYFTIVLSEITWDTVLESILFSFQNKKQVKPPNLYHNLSPKNYSTWLHFSLGVEIRVKYFSSRNLKTKCFGHMCIWRFCIIFILRINSQSISVQFLKTLYIMHKENTNAENKKVGKKKCFKDS